MALAGPRERAVLARVAQWLATGGGEVQAFLQPREPLRAASIVEALAHDSLAAIEELQLSLVHGAGDHSAFIASGARLNPLSPFFALGEPARLAFAGAAGDPDSWIGLHLAGQPAEIYTFGYRQLQGTDSGTVDFGLLEAGLYEAVLWTGDDSGALRQGAVTWFAVR